MTLGVVQLITSALPLPFSVAVAFVVAVQPPPAPGSRSGNSTWLGGGDPLRAPDTGRQEVVERAISA